MNNKQKGFTLVELVVVITLSSVLFGAGSMMLSNGLNNYFIAQQLNGLSLEAEHAIEQCARELRGAYSINRISTDKISFTNNQGMSVIYALDNTQFKRSEDNGVTFAPMSNHVSALTFGFFNEQLATTTQASSVHLITLEINFSENQNTLQLIQSIYLRNIT